MIFIGNLAVDDLWSLDDVAGRDVWIAFYRLYTVHEPHVKPSYPSRERIDPLRAMPWLCQVARSSEL